MSFAIKSFGFCRKCYAEVNLARPSPESMVCFANKLGQEQPTLTERGDFTDMADDQQKSVFCNPLANTYHHWLTTNFFTQNHLLTFKDGILDFFFTPVTILSSENSVFQRVWRFVWWEPIRLQLTRSWRLWSEECTKDMLPWVEHMRLTLRGGGWNGGKSFLLYVWMKNKYWYLNKEKQTWWNFSRHRHICGSIILDQFTKSE